MTLTIPARPTTYKGVPMRSRLEARFAAFLDYEDYPWQYEPRAYAGDGGQYLPDFQCGRLFIEVRPTLETAYKAMTQMLVILESEPEAMLLIAVDRGPFFINAPDNGRVWRTFTARPWTE